jgi:MFS family permease
VVRGFTLRVFREIDATSRRDLLILFTTGLLFWASLASLLPTLPLYLQHIGASRHQIGLLMGSIAIGLLVFRPWVGQLADRPDSHNGRFVRRIQVLMLGVVAAAVVPLGYLLTQSIPLLALIRIFHGLSIAAFTTAYSALVVDISPERQRGELLGYMSLVNPIGVAI